jgi:acyl-CoA thioesterase FadM
MPCTDELPVRFADTDAQGHTFFANYRTVCAQALTYGLSATGCDYTTMEAEEGVMFVYRDRTLFADRLRIELTPERVAGLG